MEVLPEINVQPGKGQGALSMRRLSAAFGWPSAVAVRSGWAARIIGGIGSLAVTPRIFQASDAKLTTQARVRSRTWMSRRKGSA